MSTLDRVPTQVVPPPEAVHSLRTGQPFTLVLSDDPAERAAILQAVIDNVADLETRFVHVCNPLRAPLTVERVFMQAVGPEADVRLERDPAKLTRILACQVSDETRLIVVIQQPETLDKEALDIFQAMAPDFSSVAPRLQIIFCGPAAFRSMMASVTSPAAQALAPVTEPVRLAPEPALVSPPSAARTQPAPRARPQQWRVALATLLLLFAAAGALAWYTQPQLRTQLFLVFPQLAAAPAAASARPPAPAPVQPAPFQPAQVQPAQVRPAPVLPPAPAPADAAAPPIANPAEEQSMLRREFDDFIATRPDAAGLTAPQKDELFQEFLARRRSQLQ